MKILVLAIPVGAGHMKAAQSIIQAITELQPDMVTQFENCFDWTYPLYGRIYTKVYDFGQKRSRIILKFLYRGTGVNSGSAWFLYKMHKILAYKFECLIKETKPDYVLCTHFSPGYFSALYKKNYHYKIGTVITDYYIHPHWVNNEIDHYFIPHEYLIEQVMSYGASEEKIFPFGIPVASELEKEVDRNSVRQRFGLSEKRISVVVMGSKVFGGEWFEIVREIVDFDYDLLVLCGENKQAIEQIKRLKGRANLKIYGMVEGIHDLIGTCDILITKAGGITTTEASRAGPCLLFANSIVGLEDKNEDFFIKHNAALRIDKYNAKRNLSDLLVHPVKMQEMRKNLKKIGKRDSVLNIAKIILGSVSDAKRRV